MGMKRLKMMTSVLVVICAAGVLAGCKNEGSTVNNAAGVTADITAITAAGDTTGKATDDFTNNTAGEADGHTVALTLDMRGFYTGFTGLPGDYTMMDAAAHGYVVKHNLEVVAGRAVWDQFVAASAQGLNTGVRLATFHDNEEGISSSYSDLFFQDGKYYIFESADETGEPTPFSYLLTLRGKSGNPSRDTTVTLLTNDNKLTFDKYMTALYSSNTEVIKSVLPNQLISFQLD
ncbi:hypothetical protein GC101_04325 [Paenibacillus sp. LMG 31459]|uniref:Lipoprotein n=1 Tax=Paenibacillus phytohabitans TaxID=2654978 RepID=A0ABX1YBF2_9BACL|nr:hypothetical protein [Paenibacillus phytohabitans]NOU78101.1 hypothetical protein [Paenibacillus phytohabitans]